RGEWYEERSGSVRKYLYKYPDCSLNIDKLSHKLSGVYHFRFHTSQHRRWISGTSGVTLSVTGLQVKEDVVSGKQNQIKLTCSTSCSVGSHYAWNKNGQLLQDKTTSSILLDSSRPSEVGSYSCAVGYESQRSPAVSLQVLITPTSVKERDRVTLTCITTCRLSSDPTFIWYKNGQPVTSKHTTRDNKLHLNPVSSEDAGSYSCAVRGHESLPSKAVFLNVKYLQVLITPEAVKEGDSVSLTCDTTCILTNPAFIWYKNGQPVTYQHTTRDNKLHLNPVSSEDAGSYSCAVKGDESLSSTAVFLNIKYSPRNVSVSISPGGIEAGSPVILTCSSDANPPVHTYTWYMRNGAESLARGTGESISFNLTSDTCGLYYCEAQNEVGSTNSDAVTVVTEAPLLKGIN
ncbi:B-cell receptor CD22-like, partial [Alosa alosa]|uniref:B-cell receptor CD22-like n=1 Tax=Alosa alosa TaxID=278164 RepID=UPI00201513DB